MKKKNALNYLFRNKVLNTLMFLGLFGNISFLQGQETADYPPIIQQNVVIQDSLFNPFLYENLGIPYSPPTCGNGLLSYISKKDAREVINKVFEEEGIKLQENYYYKSDSITTVVDGFNPDLNIGYIWLGRDKMGVGMVRIQVSSTKYYVEKLEQKAILTQILNTILEIENEKIRRMKYHNFAKFVSVSYREKLKETEKNTTKKILTIKSKREMAKAIQKFGQTLLSLQEARYCESIHNTEKNFIAMIGVRDARFCYRPSPSKLTLEESHKLLKMAKGRTNEEYNELYTKTIEINGKRNIDEVVRENLETQVRQYIKWAKQQSGY